MTRFLLARLAMLFLLIGVASAQTAFAQTSPATVTRPRVTGPVKDNDRATLPGHVRPFLTGATDNGLADDSVQTAPIMLMLSRTPQQQADLDALVDALHNKNSPSFHQWLTPQQFGARFQPADSDVAAVKSWLQSKGLTVLDVVPSKTFISFTGTIGQLRNAFGVEMHKFTIKGEQHVAAVNDPQVPAALAPVIASLNKLDDFSPKPMVKPAGAFTRDLKTGKSTRKPGTKPLPNFTFTDSGDTYYELGPQDFYTIYNENPLLTATTPINGAGQTIAVIEEVEVATADVTTFRSVFGLPTYPATPTSTNGGVNYLYGSTTGLGGYTSCLTPVSQANGKRSGEEGEADLDLQWSGAVAPYATVDFVACGGTNGGDGSSAGAYGTDHAAQYIVNYLSSTVEAASMSYGECEADLTSTNMAYYNGQWEQYAAEGITPIISSGDAGAEQCYQDEEDATTLPPSVNGFGSSAYNVSAGGTDFGDLYESNNYTTTPATTWWSATNGTGESSAVGYVTETSWAGYCSNEMFVTYLQYHASTTLGTNYTPWGICSNATSVSEGYTAVVGGAGGISTYNTIPTWQSVYGVGQNSVSTTHRNVPDVSLFASNGFWGHLLPYCESDEDACTVANYELTDLAAGGTSFVAPQLAGFMALVAQKTGMRQGQADYTLYNLAQQEYGTTSTAAASLTSCSGSGSAVSAGGRPPASCLFYDISSDAPNLNGGNLVASIYQPCKAGDIDCYNGDNTTATYAYGVNLAPGASTTAAPGSELLGYNVGPGYDDATGLGSLNIYGLVEGWNTVTPLFTSATALTTSAPSVSSTGTVMLTAAVTATGRGGTVSPGGTVEFFIGSTAGTYLGSGTVSSVCTGTGSATSCSGAASLTINGSSLVVGPNSIIAYFEGDGANDAPSTSTAQTVTLTASQSITFPQPTTPVLNGTTVTLTATASSGLAVTYTVVSGPATVSGSTVTITGDGQAVIAANQAGNTTYTAAPQMTVTITGIGDFIWTLGTTGTLDRVYQAGDVSLSGVGTAGTSSMLGGVAVDGSYNVWSVTTGTNTLFFTNNLDTTTGSYTGGGLNAPAAVAVDGSGYIWVANSGGGSASEFSGTGIAQSETAGFSATASLASSSVQGAPSSIAIDTTGGVWITNKTGNSVTHIFGAATPVVTPLSTAVTNSTLGSKP